MKIKMFFRKKWRQFKRLFKRTEDRDAPRRIPRGPEVPSTNEQGTSPDTIPLTGPKILGILVFTGHYEESYGTRTYNKIKEMFSNRLTNNKTKEKWYQNEVSQEVALEVEGRVKKNYTSHCRYVRKKVKEFAKRIGCEPENILAVETHYNAASVRSARGGYNMVEKGCNRSLIAAKMIIDHFVEKTPMTYRKEYKGMKGIKGMTEGRGFGFVDYANDDGAISMLFEPFYCDFMNEETEWLFGPKTLNSMGIERQMEYVAETMSKLWVDAFIEVVKRFNKRS
jgi:hypothetical protein